MPGTLVSGQEVGGAFVAEASEALAAAVGFRPYHGTLNLEGVDGVDTLPERTLDEDFGDPTCEGAVLRPCRVGGIRGAVVRPLVPDYPADLVELLAPVRLRDLFRLRDGDELAVHPPDGAWESAGVPADPEQLDRFESVVFDLDGTLLDLAVEWSVVHDEVEALLGDRLGRAVTAYTENEVFELAAAAGVRDELFDVIESLEVEGAERSSPRPLLDHLDGLSCPVAVCTANSLRSAELALDRFDARRWVDTIVARETVRPGKPDPAPLLEAFDRLSTDAAGSLFVGDHPTDAEAAVGAGSSFLRADRL